MKKENLLQRTQHLFEQKRLLLVILAFSLPVNIILAVILMVNIGTERIVIVPPSIKQSLWIEKNQASTEVLELWGDYFATLLLNVTPSNVAARTERVLSWVDSEHYAKIKTQLHKESENLKKRAISTHFTTTRLQGLVKNQSVILHGNLRILHGDSVKKVVPKTFKLVFYFQNGRPSIKQFEEVKE